MVVITVGFFSLWEEIASESRMGLSTEKHNRSHRSYIAGKKIQIYWFLPYSFQALYINLYLQLQREKRNVFLEDSMKIWTKFYMQLQVWVSRKIDGLVSEEYMYIRWLVIIQAHNFKVDFNTFSVFCTKRRQAFKLQYIIPVSCFRPNLQYMGWDKDV